MTFRYAPTQATWAAVVFTGVFGSAIAISLQSWAQARISAVRAAIIYALEPVFAAMFSVALGREQLALVELAGGGLVILGVLTTELGGRKAES